MRIFHVGIQLPGFRLRERRAEFAHDRTQVPENHEESTSRIDMKIPASVARPLFGPNGFR